jgi:hypothetical protein
VGLGLPHGYRAWQEPPSLCEPEGGFKLLKNSALGPFPRLWSAEASLRTPRAHLQWPSTLQYAAESKWLRRSRRIASQVRSLAALPAFCRGRASPRRPPLLSDFSVNSRNGCCNFTISSKS